MSSATWKNCERQLAKKMNGERVPVSGRTGEKGQEAPDIIDGRDAYAIEVKSRAKARPGGAGAIPKWMWSALDQANKSRKPGHLAAIVILHETGKRHDNDIVLMSFKDFQRLDWFVGAFDDDHR